MTLSSTYRLTLGSEIIYGVYTSMPDLGILVTEGIQPLSGQGKCLLRPINGLGPANGQEDLWPEGGGRFLPLRPSSPWDGSLILALPNVPISGPAKRWQWPSMQPRRCR